MMIVAASLFTSDHTRDFAYLLSPFPYLALAALPPNTYSSLFLAARFLPHALMCAVL